MTSADLNPQLRARVLAMHAVTAPIRVIAAVLRCDEAEVVRVLEAVKVQSLHPECTPTTPAEAAS